MPMKLFAWASTILKNASRNVPDGTSKRYSFKAALNGMYMPLIPIACRCSVMDVAIWKVAGEKNTLPEYQRRGFAYAPAGAYHWNVALEGMPATGDKTIEVPAPLPCTTSAKSRGRHDSGAIVLRSGMPGAE